MASYQRGESYTHRVSIRVAGVLTDPDDITITITNPCNSTVTDSAAMLQSATGEYYYSYQIPADAVFGEYNVSVSVTIGTDISILLDSFIVMPWNVERRVRAISGIGQAKSISDDDLNYIILNAYHEVRKNVFQHHYNESVRCSCCNENCRCSNQVCSTFNGTNTTFWTQSGYIADYSDDGNVHGFGQAPSCVTDVFMRWKDCDGNCHDGYVTVNDDECGNLTLTIDGTNPVPAAYAWVKLEYWTRTRGYSRDLMHQAVEYLAAHKVLLRLGELERATAADLTSVQNIKYVDPKRMYKEYRRILKQIRRPPVAGVR